MNAPTTTIVGPLTRDPEIRYSRAGMAETSLWISDTSNSEAPPFNVITFGELAENIALSLTKGHVVIADGVIEQVRWQTDDDTKPQYRVHLVGTYVGVALNRATVDVHPANRYTEEGSHRPI